MSAGVVLGPRLAGRCSMPAARARLRWWRLFGPSLAAVVGLLLSVAGVSAQAGPLAVVQRLIDVNNSNDLDAFFGLMTDDVIVIGIGECGGGVCAGKAAFRQELESGLEEVGAPPRLRMLGTPQVAGNTVTLRAEVRFVPNLPFFEEPDAYFGVLTRFLDRHRGTQGVRTAA